MADQALENESDDIVQQANQTNKGDSASLFIIVTWHLLILIIYLWIIWADGWKQITRTLHQQFPSFSLEFDLRSSNMNQQRRDLLTIVGVSYFLKVILVTWNNTSKFGTDWREAVLGSQLKGLLIIFLGLVASMSRGPMTIIEMCGAGASIMAALVRVTLELKSAREYFLLELMGFSGWIIVCGRPMLLLIPITISSAFIITDFLDEFSGNEEVFEKYEEKFEKMIQDMEVELRRESKAKPE
eukprot:TRINITY_DN9535_c0_g1_i1.p1 TRINITY_DN9535_c0_g1~~TRINITY_DN9535_c0_g1_i1.p1  ORF type:complete len:270 (+),score=54.09 TRINITY_DN9535_c0_g1_i1:85-810(+)